MKRATLHGLRIDGKKVCLDGFELKGVVGYDLSEHFERATEITITMLVDNVQANSNGEALTAGGAAQEDAHIAVGSEAPKEALPLVEKTPEVEDRIREIVREEMAAHKEQPGSVIQISLDAGSIARAINEIQPKSRSSDLRI